MPTPDGHLRAHARDAAADAVLGHPLPGAHHRLPGGVVLVVAGELLDVARVLAELLIELELLGLRLGRGAGRRRSASTLRLALRLGDLGVRRVEALLVLVAEVDVELPDLQDADADVVEVRRVRDERRWRASASAPTAWSRLFSSLSQSSPRSVFTPFMKRPLIQLRTWSLSPAAAWPE